MDTCCYTDIHTSIAYTIASSNTGMIMKEPILITILLAASFTANAQSCNQEFANKVRATEKTYNESNAEFHRLKANGYEKNPDILMDALLDSMEAMIAYRDSTDALLLTCGYRMSEATKNKTRNQLNDLSKRISLFKEFMNAQMNKHK